MKQWYVKELSELTKISVQTLHHYDRINLLKPSLRLSNNYRVYSEKDLLRLQQIIALKFFGFELSQIKKILQEKANVLTHLKMQSDFLDEKANALIKANKALKKIIRHCSNNKSIDWENSVKTIEVFRMTEELEKSWAAKVLNKKEFQQYVEFQQSLLEKQDEKSSFEKKWHEIVKDVNANLKNDPTSEKNILIGKRCMELINPLYGEKFRDLRSSVWEKGFKGGHVGETHGLSQEAVAWLDKAIEYYYRDRIAKIMMQIGKTKNAVLYGEFEKLVIEMCGNNKKERQDFYEAIFNHPSCTEKTKAWLNDYINQSKK